MDNDQRTRNNDSAQNDHDTENTGLGEKQGGDFGQAGNQNAETADDAKHNSSSKDGGERINNVPEAVESENSGLGEKQGGDFGQAAEGESARGENNSEANGSRAASTDQ